jgi:hypothetical protein
MKVEGIAFGPAARSAARGVARGRTVRNMAIEKRRPREENRKSRVNPPR